MGVFLLSRLRYTQQRLRALSSQLEAAADQATFLQLLSTTIRDVHALYQGHPAAAGHAQLLHHASFLEQQQLSLPLAASSPAQWRAGYQALRATLEATLAPTAPAHG